MASSSSKTADPSQARFDGRPTITLDTLPGFVARVRAIANVATGSSPRRHGRVERSLSDTCQNGVALVVRALTSRSSRSDIVFIVDPAQKAAL